MTVLKNIGVLDVTEWVADPSGTSASAAQIQACLDAAPGGARVEFPMGTYRLEAPVSFTGKQLELAGIGRVEFIQEFAAFSPMLQGSFCDGSSADNFIFTGSDDAAGYAADSSSYGYRSGLRFADAADIVATRINVSSRQTGITIDGCTNTLVDHAVIDGYGAAIAALPLASNAHVGVSIGQGSRITLRNIHTTNVGNGILVGTIHSDPGNGSVIPEYIRITDPDIRDSFDNGVYISSARHVDVISPYVKGVNSSGVRLQADHGSVVGGKIVDAQGGVAIQGLHSAGALHEGKWSGKNCSVSGTTIVNPIAIGVNFGDRNAAGFYTYGNTIDGVNIEGGAGQGGIYGTTEHTTIGDVTMMDLTGSSALRLFGSGSSPIQRGLEISNLNLYKAGTTPILCADITESTFRNIRNFEQTNPSNSWFLINDATNSDFVNLWSNSGEVFEGATSDGNLWVNVDGSPLPTDLRGSNHRAWTVEP